MSEDVVMSGRDRVTDDQTTDRPPGINGSRGDAVAVPSIRRATISRELPYLAQGATNSCGPYSLTMVLGGYFPGRYSPEYVAHLMRWLRIPRVGATLPWAIEAAAARCGLRVKSGWFGSIETIKWWLDRDRPVLVIVRPDDFPGCAWYALHYRVAVGYADDPAAPGGGWLFFNCSAAPPPFDPDRAHPGNVTLSYADFNRQWRTWLTPRWFAAVWPAINDRSRAPGPASPPR